MAMVHMIIEVWMILCLQASGDLNVMKKGKEDTYDIYN